MHVLDEGGNTLRRVRSEAAEAENVREREGGGKPGRALASLRVSKLLGVLLDRLFPSLLAIRRRSKHGHDIHANRHIRIDRAQKPLGGFCRHADSIAFSGEGSTKLRAPKKGSARAISKAWAPKTAILKLRNSQGGSHCVPPRRASSTRVEGRARSGTADAATPRAKFFQAEPKPVRAGPRKRAWIFLDSFVRFGAFQRVTSDPSQKRATCDGPAAPRIRHRDPGGLDRGLDPWGSDPKGEELTLDRHVASLMTGYGQPHLLQDSPCCHALPRRAPGDRSAAIQVIDDRLFPPGLRHAPCAPRTDRTVATGGRRNGFDGTGQAAVSFRRAA